MSRAAVGLCSGCDPAEAISGHLKGTRRRVQRLPVRGSVLSAAVRSVLTAVALAAVPLTAAGQEREPPGEVAVFGFVAERGTGNPVEAAAVRLIPDGDTAAVERLTDASGRFAIPRMPAGRYRLRIERIGYATVEQAIELLADSDVRVELVIEAAEMEPLLVVTNRQLRPDIPGWDRHRAQGFGTFITREEIERSSMVLPSEALRSVPSVQLIRRANGQGNDIFIRGCRPLLVVDGVPIATTMGGVSLDELFGPDAVEAMEVYTAGHIPPEYGFGSNPCGAVVVWTRRNLPDGTGSRRSWKWFGIAAAVFAGLLFLSR